MPDHGRTAGAGTTSLVLASASPARLTTLRTAGIEPVVIVSDVDEDAALALAVADLGRELTVAEQTAHLAQAKATAVAGLPEVADLLASLTPASSHDGAARPALLVLGCDSLLELDGVALGKPWTAEVARERWRAMRGRTATLHTGHTLIEVAGDDVARQVGALASVEITFADVDDDEIDAYVATGEPLQVAGAFTIDGYGGAFVREIRGDHHAVVGVSLPLLRGLVAATGHRYTDLWSPAPA